MEKYKCNSGNKLQYTLWTVWWSALQLSEGSNEAAISNVETWKEMILKVCTQILWTIASSMILAITPISRVVYFCCQNISESLHRPESVWRGSVAVMTLDSEAVKTKTSISNITSPRALQWYNGKQILRTQESDPMEQQGVQESVFMLLPFWVGRGKVKSCIFRSLQSLVSQTLALLPTNSCWQWQYKIVPQID